MKRIFTLLFLLCCMYGGIAQTSDSDTTKVKKRSSVSKNIGFGFGFSYSNLGLRSTPFVIVDSTGRMGNSQVQNGLGANISVFYMINISEHFDLRPSVDAHLMRARILYDTPLKNKKISDIFPIAVEIPVTAIWKFHRGSQRADGYQPSINAILGVRPAIAIQQFKSLYPTTKNTNIQIDGGVGFPFKTKKYKFSIEAIYSYGLLNLIGNNNTDKHTTSVSYLGRSYIGLRFCFN